MTLNELKYIVALADQKNFRKASEKCFVSQPTLSVAVKKLEDELGVTLFERKKSQVIITPVGEKIITLAQTMLEMREEIKKIAQDENHGVVSELRIGIIYTIAPYLLPKLIQIFQKTAPHIHLIIEENYTHELAIKLQTGAIDMAILSLPFEDNNIETAPLYDEIFVAALPKHHCYNEVECITAEHLLNETFLLLGAGHCFRDQVTESYPELLQKNHQSHLLQRTLEGSSLETIRYMVASGVGVTVLPCTAISDYDRQLLTIKPLADPAPKRTVALAWRKSFPRIKMLEQMKKALQKLELPCTLPAFN